VQSFQEIFGDGQITTKTDVSGAPHVPPFRTSRIKGTGRLIVSAAARALALSFLSPALT